MKRFPTISIHLGRLLLTLVFVGMIGAPVLAQQPYYNWRIGGGVGTMAYYGDLSYRWYATRFSVPAYTVFLEKKVSPSFGIQLNGTYGQITGNDLTKNWKGDLLTSNPDFGRALNFKTDIRAASLLLQYHFDNGHLLSQYSTFAPYVFAGVGITDFTVYGDLFDGSGNRYYYWSDNTIRSNPESNGGEVPIINQDGKYETKLTGLNTEVNNYPTTVLSIPVGVGVKIRLTDQLSANVQAGATYAFTDYLDDVSGNYAGMGYNNELQAYAANPSGVIRQSRGEGKNNQDLYFSSFVTLSYHFGYKQKNFKAPLVYTGYKTVNAPVENKTMARTKTTVPASIESNQVSIPVSGADPPVRALTNPPPMDSSRGKVVDSKNYSNGSGPTYSTSIPEPNPASSITYSSNPVGRLNDVRADSLRHEAAWQQVIQSATRSRTDAVPYSSGSIREPERIREGNIRNTRSYDYSGDPGRNERYRSNYTTDTYNSDMRRQGSRSPAPRSNYYSDRSPENARNFVPLPIPLPIGGNGADKTAMQANTDAVNQLRAELANLQAGMSKLRSQNDSVTNRKLDSLSTVVDALDRQATENLRARYGADTLGAKADNLAQSAASSSDSLLVSSLQNQIEDLNQSLSQLRSKADNTTPIYPVVSKITNYGSKTIYFGISKASLTPADKLHVADLIEKLKTDAALKLKVSGYTDQTGNAANNLLLSKKRAENIVKYITKEAGIDPGRVQVTYYGQAEKGNNKIKNNPYQRKVELELVTD